MNDRLQEISARACGSCTLCCVLPEIDALSKPADQMCRHCSEGVGCAIYQDRPKLCRDFLCSWMTDLALPDHWQPLRSHMLVYEQGPQITVLVDPAHPRVWQQGEYHADLHRWAEAAETRGQYIILFCGDEVVKIEPERQKLTARA